MVACERLARAQLHGTAAAVLARIAVAGEEKSVRHLAAKAPRNVNEFCQANDDRTRVREAFGSHERDVVGLDDLGLPIDYEAERPPKRHHRQRLER